MHSDEKIEQRKERRFKTRDDQSLGCRVFIEFEDPIDGSIIDIAPSGLRMLCQGSYTVGQVFAAELITDRLHGVFGGLIRRVEPWVDGKSVLGCELIEKIPDDVLATLAHEQVINRRRDDRVEWIQPARMSLELQADEVDIEIQECSLGGLRIISQAAIGENAQVRIRIKLGDQPDMILHAKSVWQLQEQYGYTIGLAFTRREIPPIIRQVLAAGNRQQVTQPNPLGATWLRRSLCVAAVIVTICLAIF